MSDWNGESARHYVQYTTSHDTYQCTSERLIAFAAERLEKTPETLVDLGCGNGVSTFALARHFSAQASSIIGIDSADDLLTSAQKNNPYSNVTFIKGSGENVHELAGYPVDLTLCNSAVWMMNLYHLFAGLSAAMKSGGLFAFSIPGYLLKADDGNGNVSSHPAFVEHYLSSAVHCVDDQQALAAFTRFGIQQKTLTTAAARAGLQIINREIHTIEESAQATYAALQIPVIAEGYRFGLDSGLFHQLLESTLEHLGHQHQSVVEWCNFLLIKNGS